MTRSTEFLMWTIYMFITTEQYINVIHSWKIVQTFFGRPKFELQDPRFYFMILNSFNVSYIVMGLSVITPHPPGFPGGASGQELSCQLSCRRHKRCAFDPWVALEEGMAIHSVSILAWRILWTEEPGRLWSAGSHRVGHNLSDLAHTHARPPNSYVEIPTFNSSERDCIWRQRLRRVI